MNIYCCVYWIHRKVHACMFSQGYVGISKTPKDRYTEHKRKPNKHLERAFKKYDDIIMDIVLVGDVDYCKLIEEKIRPANHIGWNIEKGGGIPPSRKGLGRGKLIYEVRIKEYESRRGKRGPHKNPHGPMKEEHKALRRKPHTKKRNPPSQETKDKIAETLRRKYKEGLVSPPNTKGYKNCSKELEL